MRNRAVKSEAKTTIRKADDSISSSEAEIAREAVRQAVSILDRSAKKGVLARDNVARRKSRLQRKFNSAFASLEVVAQKPGAKKKAATPKKKAATPRKKAPTPRKKSTASPKRKTAKK